ncbi:MAG: restriction endonuclease subunit S [Bacteroidales bacterium]
MKKYPKYKLSGVEWFHEIPINWDIQKIKFQGKVISGSTPETSREEFWEGDIVWATPVDFGSDSQKYIYTSSRKITPEGLNNIGGKLIPKGAVIISSRAPIGLVAIAGVNLATNQGCKSIVPKKINSEYLFFCLKEFCKVLENLGNETVFAELSLGSLKNFLITIPQLTEQLSIVRFLDYKTNQIDCFIANRQKQMELLKEQKAAIINKAVTKGIKPDVKMKLSGIEWLPEVPESWNVWKMKFLTQIETGNKNTEDAEENGAYPFYVRSDNVERISTYSFEGEAILTAGDGVGVAKVYHYANCKMAIHQRVYKISHFKKVYGEYLYYYIRDNFEKEVIKLSAKTTVDSLRMPMLANFPVAYPTMDEQQLILDYIKTESQTIETLISKYQKQIDLMQEYRTSLISQAVTGKIDVSEWRPKAKKYSTEQLPLSIAAEK